MQFGQETKILWWAWTGKVVCIVATCLSLFLAAERVDSPPRAHAANRTQMEIDHSTTGFALSGGHAQVQCERCHMQGIFRGTPRQCAQCHSPGGRIVSTYKPANHLPTTVNCDSCHRTTAWTPVNTYIHRSVAYKPHRSSVACAACHTTNNEVIVWRFAAYRPDCAGCHAGDFRPNPHKKVESPTIYYSVAELKDCSGSCHVYTNATMTTIRRMRSGEHSSTGGGF